MFITKISDLKDLKDIEASEFANNLAKKKGNVFYLKIDEINLSATQILKQESISLGADFIVPKDNILGIKKNYCGILIASENQLEKLIKKCKIQSFGLKECAKKIESHLTKIPPRNIKIMGIINVTDDSFYAKSRIKELDSIIKKIHEMIENGAKIIDIGAASSRPGSKFVESKVELRALDEVFKVIKSEKLHKHADFSIDSYNFKTIKRALNHHFSIINDINGLKDSKIIALGAEFGAHIILMHNSWIVPHGKNVIKGVDEFFEAKLAELHRAGIKNKKIWLDVGFGFGKNAEENLALIKHLAHFRRFGCELLIGASRKRTIGEVTNKDTDFRLSGTLALHQMAIINGANIIRCHDVSEHCDVAKMVEKFL